MCRFFFFAPPDTEAPTPSSGKAEKSNTKAKGLLIIHAHGNATDCGAMLPTYINLRENLNKHRHGAAVGEQENGNGAEMPVAVLAVEYCAYGAAEGDFPRGSTAAAPLEAAFLFATSPRNIDGTEGDSCNGLGYSPQQVVLYGQSIGSASVCRVAAKYSCTAQKWFCSSFLKQGTGDRQQLLGGVVLHSPIASGLRTITPDGCCSPVCCCSYFEPFSNTTLARRVSCPFFIIHGTEDNEVPLFHGKMLAETRERAGIAEKDKAYWVEGAGHSNIIDVADAEYYRQLYDFLLLLWARREISA